jgi:hypothetical protein
MDFTQHNGTPSPAGTPANNRAQVSPAGSSKKKGDKKWNNKIVRWATLVLLVSGCLLVLALIASIAFTKTQEESKYVAKDQMQAVFLNGGQVYFGNITTLNEDYLVLSNIYYLRVNQTVQPNQAANSNSSNDVSLVKLGCELHGPTDQMVIKNAQVIFWENLKADGQVAKAVAQYQKDNPNGQNCSQANANDAATTPTTAAPKKQ